MKAFETQPASLADIGARRAAAVRQLDQLRQKCGVAALEGRTFDNSAIEALEREIDALGHAEAELARRERAAHRKAVAAWRAQTRRAMRKSEEQRLEAIDRADKAATALAEALADAVRHGADVAAAGRALQAPIIHSLSFHTYEQRLAYRLTSALRPLLGTRRRFGGIAFPEASQRHAGAWKASEQAEAAEQITAAMKGTTDDA